MSTPLEIEGIYHEVRISRPRQSLMNGTVHNSSYQDLTTDLYQEVFHGRVEGGAMPLARRKANIHCG